MQSNWFYRVLPYAELIFHSLLMLFYFSSVNVKWSEHWLIPADRSAILAPISAIALPLFFYLNAFVFIPKLLSGKHWYRYFLITILLLILAELCRATLTYALTDVFSSFKAVLLHKESLIIGRPNFLITIAFLSFAYRFSIDWIRNRKTIAELEAEKSKMELNLLKSQVDPHFLFNNLNALDELIDSDPLLAREYVQRLAKLYRYTLLQMEEDVVALEKEWEFVQDYIFLLEKRFGNIYEFQLSNHIPQGKLIPPSALQSLIENAVKHNQGTENEPLQIEIYTSDERIVVKHLKREKVKPGSSLGTGLNNLQNRYALLTDHTIYIEEDEYFTVTLPLIDQSQ